MPSGRTHDRITLWSSPFIAGLTFGYTQSSDLTLIVPEFLFSGLMFGPDLDLHSVQYKRWGPLRLCGYPTKNSTPPIALVHGLIVGTTLRVLYLASWLGILGIFGLGIAQVWDVGWNWQLLAQVAKASTQYASEWIALFIGLELGALSHSLSDWGGSIQTLPKRSLLPMAKLET